MIRHIPIIFSPVMVDQLIELKKTQTIRVSRLKELNTYSEKRYEGLLPNGQGYLTSSQRKVYERDPDSWHLFFVKVGETWRPHPVRCPYGKRGDLLWVKELHCHSDTLCKEKKCELDHYIYKEPYTDNEPDTGLEKWVSPFYMPKHASRITLKVKSIQPVIATTLDESDIKREGLNVAVVNEMIGRKVSGRADLLFEAILDDLYGKNYYESSPFVWKIRFSFLEQNILTIGKVDLPYENL